MDGDRIRQSFLKFFRGQGPHRHAQLLAGARLVTPPCLFTSAGMVPFKPYFMGEATPPSQRLTSCQKSFRTTDVDEVGDHKHLTFFEMLGNFSIGDYFKKEAVAWSWEFVTEVFKLEPERLFVTIYLGRRGGLPPLEPGYRRPRRPHLPLRRRRQLVGAGGQRGAMRAVQRDPLRLRR